MDEIALRLDPNYMAVRRGVPLMHSHLGNLILESDSANARLEFQTALQLYNALPLAQRQKRQQVRYGAYYIRKIAAADAELGEYSLAAPLFSQALAIYQQLADTDAKDVSTLADLYRVISDQSSSYEYAADPLLADAVGKDPQIRKRNLQAAASSLQQCAATLRRIIQLAPSQVGWKSELTDIMLRLNSIQVALGMPSLSADEITMSVEELR